MFMDNQQQTVVTPRAHTYYPKMHTTPKQHARSASSNQTTNLAPQAPNRSFSQNHLLPNEPTTEKSSHNSLSTSDNKICQWYCCSCGQSYGSVLYRDDYREVRPNGQPPQKRARSLDSSNYILDSLKYYSQVVYRDHKHVISNASFSSSSSVNNNADTNYFDCKTTTTDSSTQSTEGSHSPIIAPNTPMLSPLHLNLNHNSFIDYGEKVILNIPTRFTCHRCDHMMCPYCLKLRLKDLDIS
ncbi:conserved hypothetical protein [Candida dubliniensis CD36]|uniref:Uncharacterized protein n=1 Tax=Candida dubliniensis (strain CD36 / ATCC MYA-646 / CBS 7987 / NCPF 3949 / NRRL Y-17841) TaxID=573826 RepID=B9WD14_CANDC|nr:conserved hypothetical protein [Candida dubliniensis CD36]CAX42563.1 conserved hypothetical protein [Candida dubliniensis CD36]